MLRRGEACVRRETNSTLTSSPSTTTKLPRSPDYCTLFTRTPLPANEWVPFRNCTQCTAMSIATRSSNIQIVSVPASGLVSSSCTRTGLWRGSPCFLTSRSAEEPGRLRKS